MAFDVRAGSFLNDKSIYYADYRHFKGTRTLISDQQSTTFLLLDYYQHSTSGNFVEAHGEYNLSTLLTGKVRSEEHTSELQSLMRISYAVFCLKKKKIHTHHSQHANNT